MQVSTLFLVNPSAPKVIKPLRRSSGNTRRYLKYVPFYKLPFGVVYSHSVKSFAIEFNCFWVLDIIAGCQSELNQEEFQYWILKKNDNCTSDIICLNENSRIIKKEHIPFCDVEFDKAAFILKNGMIRFPHEEYASTFHLLNLL